MGVRRSVISKDLTEEDPWYRDCGGKKNFFGFKDSYRIVEYFSIKCIYFYNSLKSIENQIYFKKNVPNFKIKFIFDMGNST